MSCKICGSREFIDYTVDRDYEELNLGSNYVDVGALGEFINELNVIMDGKNEEIYLESSLNLGKNETDIYNNTRILIKYCPFCGREFGF